MATSFCSLPYCVAYSICAICIRAIQGMVVRRNKELSSPRSSTESLLGSGLYIQCPTSPPFTHMYDRRGREMYYADEKQKQVDPSTVFSLDLFRVDSECVFGMVVCLVGVKPIKIVSLLRNNSIRITSSLKSIHILCTHGEIT